VTGDTYSMWAIEYTHPGSGWSHIDPMTVRSLRKDAWGAWEDQHAGATDLWRKRLKKDRRKGHYRAVRVKIEVMN